ncbi:MAG TPA: ABC transporter permease [Bryobacteraceae bacterium]|nr:ABC transporter permease [Bryobacteraceae bacterium]
MNLFRRGRVAHEIDEEIRFHIEARIRDNIAAGMTHDEARRYAEVQMGGSLQAREAAQEADILIGLATFGQDVRYAMRGLRKNHGVTVIAVLSLALAIAANTDIFSIVNAVLLRSLPYQDAGRIAILWTSNVLNHSVEQATSVPNMQDWKQRSHTFEDMAAYRDSAGPVVTHGASDEAVWSDYAWVTGNFFPLLGRAPILGRVFGDREFSARTSAAVLSHTFWQRQFGGSPDVLGKTLNSGGAVFEIIGVMPPDFRFPDKEVQFWLPASLSARWQSSQGNRAGRFGTVFGKLRPGMTFEDARTEMRLIASSLANEYPDANRDLGVNIVPLQIKVIGKSVPFMLAVLCGAVLFVLLIACANVANLLLARGVVRAREISLRIALGAGRARIVRQLLTESILLSCVAGCLSMLLVAGSMRGLLALAPPNIARLDEVRLDVQVLLFCFAISLLSGTLFGLAPAIRIARGGSAGGLHGNTRNSASGRAPSVIRSSFVVCQIALAVVLLSGAGLLIRSLLAIQSVDPGFGDRHVVTATVLVDNALPGPRRVAFYRQALEHIRHLPGVRAVGAIGSMFWSNGGGAFGLRAVEGRPPETQDQWTPLTWTTITGDYFQAVGVPLLRGRFFSDQDREDSPPVVLINEAAARRYWPGEDPLGKHIKGFDPRGKNDAWVTVVGVVRDVHSQGLERAPMAQIFEAQSQSLNTTQTLVISAPGGALLNTMLRNAVHELDRTAAILDISTIDGELAGMTAQRRFQTELLGGFALLALALAAAGIFGMMHYSVVQRTQEIGIRMALGARRASVLAMVLREGLVLAVVGVSAGVAGSLALMRAISSLLFGVTPRDPLTFATVSLVLGIIALIGCYLPAQRAMRVDPMIALRSE